MIGNLLAALAGISFAVGLVIGGMTQPDKVIGFLDFAGSWDPSLAMVMAGALATYGIGVRLVTRRAQPISGEVFEPAHPGRIDARLLAGAALFGVGWGTAGFCPGPGIVSLGPASLGAALFVAGMVGGQFAFERWERRRPGGAQPTAEATAEDLDAELACG